MALDERYIVASDLEQYFVDKDSGLPLAGGTLTFYRDSARNTPKTVYQLSGSPPNYTYTPLPNPVVLSSVGTVQNSGGDNEVIYYYPYDADGEIDLYYIVCRDSGGIEQFSREAWPNITAGTDPTAESFAIANQIANPQFSRVLINTDTTTTYTVSAATNQVFEFAPDWDFVISGTGTVIVERQVISGNEHVVTSPPYVVDVTISAGVTSCFLRQRMNINSGLWASTATQPIFLAATLVARNETVGSTGLQMFYSESTGGTPVNILDDSFDNSGYSLLRGTSATAIPLSTNTDTGESGYIDIYISFPLNSHISLTSVQVVPTLSSAGGDLLSYDLNSSNREQALQGDYYIPRLEAKPIASILAGWDFPVNPAQLGTAFTMTGSAAYTWDQTICARVTSNNTVARNSVTSGFQVTTGANNDAFYMMQYLTGAQAKKILGTRLSVNVNGWKGSVGDSVTMRVYLFRATAAATLPTLATSIGTLATSGVFTLTQAGWTEIDRSGLSTAQVNLTTVATNDGINDDVDYGFTGWEITDATQIGDTDKFAIVVTFSYPTAATIITINSISVVPGDIPTRPAYKSFEDTLAECQYYYEKSYNNGTAPGNAASGGVVAQQVTSPMTGSTAVGSISIIPRSFGFSYNTVKRTSTPTVTLYSPDSGTSARVYGVIFNNGANIFAQDIPVTSWTETYKSSKDCSFIPNTVSPGFTSGSVTGNQAEAYVVFHYAVNARLGEVA